jgi:hypothetical protein
MMKRWTFAAVMLAIAGHAAGQTSPDNSRVPPLASVRDAAGGVFTLAAGTGPRAVLRGGAATGGVGSVILVWAGRAYVLGNDGLTWFQYPLTVGAPWLSVGTVDPSLIVPLPPVLLTGSSRLGWLQPGQTVAQAMEGVTRLYVDDLGTGLVLPAVCTVVSGATDCTAPIPPLTTGLHTLAITYTPKGGTPVGRSNTISVTVTITPTGLGLRP